MTTRVASFYLLAYLTDWYFTKSICIIKMQKMSMCLYAMVYHFNALGYNERMFKWLNTIESRPDHSNRSKYSYQISNKLARSQRFLYDIDNSNWSKLLTSFCQASWCSYALIVQVLSPSLFVFRSLSLVFHVNYSTLNVDQK